MKEMTKNTIRSFILNTVLLLLLLSGIPFFINIAGISIWIMSILISILVPILVILLFIMDTIELDDKVVKSIENMNDAFKPKYWFVRAIGYVMTLTIAYTLYANEWVIAAYYWIILTILLTLVFNPIIRARLNDLLKAHNAKQHTLNTLINKINEVK